MGLRGLFQRLKQGLARTRGVFSGIAQLFGLRGKVDQHFLDQLERQLILADVGTAATAEIVDGVRQSFLDKDISGDVRDFVKSRLRDMLTGPSEGIHYAATKPTVVLIAGVNGSGKTTSIAKLVKLCQDEGKKVLLVLDATTGQNAIAQAEMFGKAVQCTGIILTKLDGTAKGGAIFSIKKKLGLPVKFVGVGEQIDDLELFDPESYVAALFE